MQFIIRSNIMNKSLNPSIPNFPNLPLIRFDPPPPALLGPILSPHFLVFPVSLFFYALLFLTNVTPTLIPFRRLPHNGAVSFLSFVLLSSSRGRLATVKYNYPDPIHWVSY